jgi:ectoine hydroxylase-related dioxygenase (phytanoyl-CoA dioxygenase family)
MAFDEAWIMAAQIGPMLERVTGNPLSFDWMGFRVPSGQAGFAPHRDKDTGGFSGETGFRADGSARYATCWIALVDVPPTSSCLMCVPKGHDPGYLQSGRLHNPIVCAEDLAHILPLPLAAGACGWARPRVRVRC